MKKALKKLAAVAMAFTLLGTGTAFTNTITPQAGNKLIANAECMHKIGTHYSEWKVDTQFPYYDKDGNFVCRYVFQSRTVTDYCTVCGYTFNTRTEHRMFP